MPCRGAELLEELVHDFGALGEGWPDLVPVDTLGHGRAAVADQACDVFQGYVVGAAVRDRLPATAADGKRGCPGR
jgi:hypothetical protein